MRPLLLCLLTAAVLATAPSTALAKGISSAEICGADGCESVAPADMYTLLPEGNATAPPKVAVPFLTINLKMAGAPDAEQQGFGFEYLPSLGITRPHDSRNVGEWVQLLPRSSAALAQAVRGIEPRPASELTGVPQPPRPRPQPPAVAADPGPPWWALLGVALAGLALLGVLARYATSALKARPRASKSAN